MTQSKKNEWIYKNAPDEWIKAFKDFLESLDPEKEAAEDGIELFGDDVSEEKRELPADVLETLEALEWYAERSMVTEQIKHHLNRLREQLGRHYLEGDA